MKRILFNILGVLGVAASITACHPTDKLYDAIGPLPTPNGTAQTFSVTLTAADYGLLPTGNPAKTALYFKTIDDAKASIPTILASASKYPNYAEKSSATVTYANAPVTIKLADSLNANTAYTLINPDDYKLLPGNTFTDFSTAQTITWLPYKFPSVVENTLKVLTYNYFESGKTSNAGVLQTDAYLYMNATWQKIYRVSNAQYASVGNGVNNWFIANDVPNLVSYLNSFLKADPAVSATAKFGNVIYVNYRYLTTYQRVLPLTFDGTNWVTSPILTSLAFVKTNGIWVADNTVTYKLTAADYTLIKTMPTTVNIQTALDNVAQFGDYNITVPVSPTTGWTDAQVNASIVLILAHDFPTAVTNQKFVITYVAYNGTTFNVTKTFIYNGTTFVVAP